MLRLWKLAHALELATTKRIKSAELTVQRWLAQLRMRVGVAALEVAKANHHENGNDSCKATLAERATLVKPS
jgi:hypothetical protein